VNRSSWRVDPALAIAIVAQILFGAAFIASTRFDVRGQTYFTLFDDAMVSMTYARNFAEGAGLVWNPGGPAVEGYTNFLWTVWMAALHFAGAPESTVALLVMLSGLVLLVANTVVVGRIARLISASITTARVAVLTASLCYPLMFWTLRGMEVGLMALVVNLALLQALSAPRGDHLRIADFIWLVLLPLIRPDGVVPAAIIALFAGWTWMRAGQLPRALVIVASPFVILLAHTGLRLWLYGDLLPNTYYLKVSGVPWIERISRGAATLWETVQSNLWLTFALGLLVRADKQLQLIFAIVVTQLCYSVWVGGDAWEQSHYANRYVAVVLPLAVLLAARGVEELFSGRSIVRVLIAGVVGQILLSTAVSHALALSTVDLTTWPAAISLVGVVLKGAIGAWFLVAAATVVMNRPFFSRRPSIGVLIPVSGALLLTLSGPFIAEWVNGEALHVRDDARMARLGLDLRASTSPTASLGVVWAGAIPYFSQRRAVDFLGKSDVHVAHLPPKPPFVPGHNKWDYAYSVGVLRPDVIVQTWRATSADVRLIRSFGYEPLGSDSFVRTGSSAVDVNQLARVFDEFERTAPSAPSRPQR
jgi:arabinofuranosyltransferase